MSKIIQNILLLLSLFFAWNICLAIDKIEIYSLDKNVFLNTYEFNSPFDEVTDSYLELGDNIDAQIVKITTKRTNKFRVSVQFETSLTIMDEGPHIDLTEWKHCTTNWVNLKSTKPNEFTLPEATLIDEKCFPIVSDEEVKSEIHEVAGKRWSSLLKGDIDVHKYPLGVSLSTVRMRFQERINDTWNLITIINFKIPMGC